MKIDRTELADIIGHRAYGADTGREKACPKPQKLIALMRNELPRNKRKKVIDHLSNCYSCVREIKFINQMMEAEKDFEAGTVKILSNRLSERRRAKGRPFLRLSWNAAGALAGVAVVVAATLLWISNREQPALERNTSVSVERMSPDNRSVLLDKLVFEWTGVHETDYYTLEIFDDSLALLWRSENLTDTSLVPPEDLKEILKRETTYLWMVTAHLNTGTHFEYKLTKFKVK